MVNMKTKSVNSRVSSMFSRALGVKLYHSCWGTVTFRQQYATLIFEMTKNLAAAVATALWFRSYSSFLMLHHEFENAQIHRNFLIHLNSTNELLASALYQVYVKVDIQFHGCPTSTSLSSHQRLRPVGIVAEVYCRCQNYNKLRWDFALCLHSSSTT